jgi:hypothetical protein
VRQKVDAYDEVAELQRLQVANSSAARHPAVHMWRGIDALPNSEVLYGEFMRVAKLGMIIGCHMTLVGTCVMDERAFSTMTFVQNCLRARLTTHLPLCVRMKCRRSMTWTRFRILRCSLSVRASCWPLIAC